MWQHGIRRAEAFLKFINSVHPHITFGNGPNLLFKPLFWKRYEDGVYCVWQHGIRRAEAFLKFVRSARPRITWTSGMKEKDALPFSPEH